MMVKLKKSKLIVATLICVLISTSFIAIGCQEEVIQPPTTLIHNEISTTLVPNIDLDMYVYARQENPTIVPEDLFGTSSDIVAESLALWGISTEDAFILGGALKFDRATDATEIHAQISDQAEIWTKLSDRTIYFVYGAGTVAETMKSAISRNNFKQYDNQEALQEVALLPDTGNTKLAAIGIVTPSESLTELIADNINSDYSGMVNTLLAQAKLQVLTVGLYAPQQIDVAEITQMIEHGSIWESNLGILATIKSGLPGPVVSPIVRNILDSAEYVETKIGGITFYKGSLDMGNNKAIPIIIRIEGNRIFVSLSGQESFAQTLIMNVNM